MHILQYAKDTDAERAVFNDVGGDQHNGDETAHHGAMLNVFRRILPRKLPASAPAARMLNSRKEMHVLGRAVRTKATYAIFNSVKGDQYKDPAAATRLAKITTPAKSQGERTKMHVLEGAQHTDVKFGVFSCIGGDQYGLPQGQANTTSTSNSTHVEFAEPGLR